MKAIRIHNYGSYKELKYEEIPVPEINGNQLLIKVYAVSVNHLEIKKASGVMKDTSPLNFPWIPGHDFAGIVEKIGDKVTTFKTGDKVYGNCMGGSYAQYLAADLNKVTLMPTGLSFTEAASVPHVAETAWQALYKHGNLKKGETVLIHGAAGAVGAFAVQFARNTGASILTSVAAADIDYVKALGANEAIDFKTQDFTRYYSNVDLVLSLVGANVEKLSYSVMKNGGRLVSTVGIAHKDIAEQKDITAIPMVIQQNATDLKQITDLINNGKVKTDVALTFPLQDAAKGWQVLTGDPSVPQITHGKIVLEVE